MLLALLEELVPTFDELAFGLVLDELELIDSPALLNSVDEILENGFTAGLGQDILDNLVLAE